MKNIENCSYMPTYISCKIIISTDKIVADYSRWLNKKKVVNAFFWGIIGKIDSFTMMLFWGWSEEITLNT